MLKLAPLTAVLCAAMLGAFIGTMLALVVRHA